MLKQALGPKISQILSSLKSDISTPEAHPAMTPNWVEQTSAGSFYQQLNSSEWQEVR